MMSTNKTTVQKLDVPLAPDILIPKLRSRSDVEKEQEELLSPNEDCLLISKVSSNPYLVYMYFMQKGHHMPFFGRV